MNTIFVRTTLLAIVAAFTVAGCQTTDAYTGEKKVNNTTKGAGIGAAAGAVLGALTGDNSKERRERALIGAGVGALTGAGVGAYMDKQEAKLRASFGMCDDLMRFSMSSRSAPSSSSPSSFWIAFTCSFR